MKSCPLILATSLLFLIMFSGCHGPVNTEQAKKELLEYDASFSRLSVEQGSNKAFLTYISDDCVLLRPNKQPIRGKDKIIEMFSKKDDNFTLSWTPLFADVSQSLDLGYTYGTYKTEMYTPEGDLLATEGTYVSIWKKDTDGKWKFVLDTGNQGLGKKGVSGE